MARNQFEVSSINSNHCCSNCSRSTPRTSGPKTTFIPQEKRKKKKNQLACQFISLTGMFKGCLSGLRYIWCITAQLQERWPVSGTSQGIVVHVYRNVRACHQNKLEEIVGRYHWRSRREPCLEIEIGIATSLTVLWRRRLIFPGCNI